MSLRDVKIIDALELGSFLSTFPADELCLMLDLGWDKARLVKAVRALRLTYDIDVHYTKPTLFVSPPDLRELQSFIQAYERAKETQLHFEDSPAPSDVATLVL